MLLAQLKEKSAQKIISGAASSATCSDESWFYTKAPELCKPKENKRDCHTVIFIDGVLSSNLPEGIFLSKISEEHVWLSSNPLYLDESFNALYPVCSNSAYGAGGILLNVADNVKLEKPLEIYYLSNEGSVMTHNCFIVGKNSSVEIYEYFLPVSQLGQPYEGNHVSRLFLDHRSNVRHYRIQDEAAVAQHIYTAKAQVESAAEYYHLSFSTGAKLSRQEIHVDLVGEKAKCFIDGVVLGNEDQHHDAYLPINHISPNAYSKQHFRQVLDDNAKGIFYGKAIVPRGAYKTEAHQLNCNLLLSKKAKVYTRPELEILNDSVICSHGATVGNLDKEALYYLQSRGISYNDAVSMLVYGFINTIIEGCGQGISSMLANRVMQWMQK